MGSLPSFAAHGLNCGGSAQPSRRPSLRSSLQPAQARSDRKTLHHWSTSAVGGKKEKKGTVQDGRFTSEITPFQPGRGKEYRYQCHHAFQPLHREFCKHSAVLTDICSGLSKVMRRAANKRNMRFCTALIRAILWLQIRRDFR